MFGLLHGLLVVGEYQQRAALGGASRADGRRAVATGIIRRRRDRRKGELGLSQDRPGDIGHYVEQNHVYVVCAWLNSSSPGAAALVLVALGGLFRWVSS